jgi:hypothetical protein
MKAGRYVFFALPYLFATWGLAGGSVFPRAVQIGYGAWARIWSFVAESKGHSPTALEQRLRRYTFAALAVVALAFAVVCQVSYRESAKLMVQSAITVLSRPARLLSGPPVEPWTRHRDELAAMVKRASIFVTAAPPETALVLGPFDLILNRSPPEETLEQGEFALDPRVGRATIATVESMQAVMDCYPTGIVVVPGEYWRNKAAVTEDVANLLMATANLTRMNAPGAPDELLVFEWKNDPRSSAGTCNELRLKLLPNR